MVGGTAQRGDLADGVPRHGEAFLMQIVPHLTKDGGDAARVIKVDDCCFSRRDDAADDGDRLR
ncbi:hypothetical protein SDC9_186495 [bioreactor metagenome]|uniref:Uncharacterized protein n=1 Tax=bioreactor metagenome TaxID=1076179 RepID=A0A645HJP5_9ZZZZ